MRDLASPARRRPRSAVVVLRILLGAGFALGVSSLGALVAYVGQKGGRPPAALQSTLKASVAPGFKHDWRLVRDKHWQIVSRPKESQEAIDTAEGTRGACSAGLGGGKGPRK